MKLFDAIYRTPSEALKPQVTLLNWDFKALKSRAAPRGFGRIHSTLSTFFSHSIDAFFQFSPFKIRKAQIRADGDAKKWQNTDPEERML